MSRPDDVSSTIELTKIFRSLANAKTTVVDKTAVSIVKSFHKTVAEQQIKLQEVSVPDSSMALDQHWSAKHNFDLSLTAQFRGIFGSQVFTQLPSGIN